jgi:hypothetical protein
VYREDVRIFVSGRLRTLLTWLAGAALAFTLVTLLERARPVSNIFGLAIVTASPFAPFVALAGLALAGMSRRIVLTIIAVLVVTVSAAVQLPRYYFARPAADTRYADISILSANLRRGHADASSFVTLAESNADVIMVSELTPEAAQHFSGLDKAFP